MTRPRIAIVGAGAIGGYLGAQLTAHGQDCVLIDAWHAHVEAMRQQGLRIEQAVTGTDRTVPVQALHVGDVQSLWRQAPIDLAVIAVKSYDTPWAAALLLPCMASDACFVSVQNGINEGALASVVGADRTLGCVVMLAAELMGPAHIRRTSGPQTRPAVEFRFGELDGRRTPRVELLATLVDRFDGTDITDNLASERWSKLCFNALHNGLSAVTDLTAPEWKRDPEIRRFAIRLGGEAVRAGRALGLGFERVGNLAAGCLAQALDGDLSSLATADTWLKEGGLGVARTSDQRPSLAQDMRKGRRTEIDFINGHIVAQAAMLGLTAGANAALVDLVHAVERGTVVAHPDTVINLERVFQQQHPLHTAE